MGFLDRLFGTESAQQNPSYRVRADSAPRSEDDIALEKYRYLLRTAPPETIEQVHAEAFAKLTEPQRQQVLAEMSAGLSPAEQPRSSEPQAMARAATRAEYTNPGFMERTLGPRGQTGQGGPSFGSMMGSSLLGTVAGYVIGSAIVSSFMAPAFADGGAADSGADTAAADSGSADTGSDFGGADVGGGDFGGGFGDFGF